MQSEIATLFDSKEFSASIRPIENYLQYYPQELMYKLKLARAYLYNEKLDVPTAADEIFQRNTKIQKIKENYKKAAESYEAFLKEYEPKTSNTKELGRYYYEWAFAELYLEKKEKAIFLFEKSLKNDPTLIESYYNLYFLKETVQNKKEGMRYLKKYLEKKNEKK